MFLFFSLKHRWCDFNTFSLIYGSACKPISYNLICFIIICSLRFCISCQVCTLWLPQNPNCFTTTVWIINSVLFQKRIWPLSKAEKLQWLKLQQCTAALKGTGRFQLVRHSSIHSTFCNFIWITFCNTAMKNMSTVRRNDVGEWLTQMPGTDQIPVYFLNSPSRLKQLHTVLSFCCVFWWFGDKRPRFTALVIMSTPGDFVQSWVCYCKLITHPRGQRSEAMNPCVINYSNRT